MYIWHMHILTNPLVAVHHVAEYAPRPLGKMGMLFGLVHPTIIPSPAWLSQSYLVLHGFLDAVRHHLIYRAALDRALQRGFGGEQGLPARIRERQDRRGTRGGSADRRRRLRCSRRGRGLVAADVLEVRTQFQLVGGARGLLDLLQQTTDLFEELRLAGGAFPGLVRGGIGLAGRLEFGGGVLTADAAQDDDECGENAGADAGKCEDGAQGRAVLLDIRGAFLGVSRCASGHF